MDQAKIEELLERIGQLACDLYVRGNNQVTQELAELEDEMHKLYQRMDQPAGNQVALADEMHELNQRIGQLALRSDDESSDANSEI
ncbi:MAG: hypothetical protein MHMPM18_005209 [Marteilia pararefringens]